MTIQGAVRNQLVLAQGNPLRRMEAQRPVVCPTNRQWFHVAPARPSPQMKAFNSEPTVFDSLNRSEADVFDREAEPTDENSWSHGHELLWLNNAAGWSEGGKGPTGQPSGPYIRTDAGLVYVSIYCP